MRREDVWGAFGSLFLFGMAYLDAQWRWFWAFAGVAILGSTIYTAFFSDDKMR